MDTRPRAHRGRCAGVADSPTGPTPWDARSARAAAMPSIRRTSHDGPPLRAVIARPQEVPARVGRGLARTPAARDSPLCRALAPSGQAPEAEGRPASTAR